VATNREIWSLAKQPSPLDDLEKALLQEKVLETRVRNLDAIPPCRASFIQCHLLLFLLCFSALIFQLVFVQAFTGVRGFRWRGSCATVFLVAISTVISL